MLKHTNISLALLYFGMLNSFSKLLLYAIKKKNVDGAMHFIYSHKFNTNSAEDSSDMN